MGTGGGSGEAVPPGPSWKALLGSQPPRAPPSAALASPALLLGWAGPWGCADASRSRVLRGAWGRSSHGRPRRRAGSGVPGPARAAANLQLPAARPLGRGEARIWRPLPPFQSTRPGLRPRSSGKPRDSAPGGLCTGCHRGYPAQLPADGRGARALRSTRALICWRGRSAASSVFFPVSISKTPFG